MLCHSPKYHKSTHITLFSSLAFYRYKYIFIYRGLHYILKLCQAPCPDHNPALSFSRLLTISPNNVLWNDREKANHTSSVCHFTLIGDMIRQTNIAQGTGAEFEGLLLNIAKLPYSFMTALKIELLLATAVLSVEMGYYERVHTAK